ncbi:hypothetical protein [Capnocytophaga sp.]
MKNLFLALLLLCIFNISSTVYSQSYYTTQSKSCGSCGNEVSANSTVGMRCPHCGVIWGRENEHRTTTKKTNSYNKSYNSSNYNYSNSSNINNSKSYDMTPAKTIVTASLRKGASAKSELLFNIPKDRNVYIVGKKGNWYYVSCPTYYADERYKKKLYADLQKASFDEWFEIHRIVSQIEKTEKKGRYLTDTQVLEIQSETSGMKESPLKGYIHSSSLRLNR